MKKRKKTIVYLSYLMIITTLITSCSMEKRIYMSGYHMEWAKNKKIKEKKYNHNKEIVYSLEEKKTNKIDTSLVKNIYLGNLELSNITNIKINTSLTASIGKNQNINSQKIKHHIEKTKNVINKKESSIKSQIQPKKEKPNSKKSTSKGGEGKSQLVALIICIFVGVIGIHRFYLGYIGIGIVQLLTLGCCGIWSLIDLIMIITGDLKPYQSDYETKM